MVTLSDARERQRQRRALCLGAPLRAGARGRVGNTGVARRPTRHETCARVEPHSDKKPGGPVYYCSKHYEKPRIPTGEAAILEDPRRPGLWRLHLPRNCAQVSDHLIAGAIVLGANVNAQPVLTVKGAADYVTKYITKYGASQSVHARVTSLLDDIISKVPEHKTTTVASLLTKAFLSSAIPESLSSLEAWHLLWQLPRTVRSRYFKPLNMDGAPTVKKPKVVLKEGEGAADDPKVKAKKQLVSKTTIELYKDRSFIPCKDHDLHAALEHYSLLRFASEININEAGVCRMKRPRVVNVKPFLQLDLKRPTAPKQARMALRLLRPWDHTKLDPANLFDEDAVNQLVAFVETPEAPRWFKKRFAHHNRERKPRAPQGLRRQQCLAQCEARAETHPGEEGVAGDQQLTKRRREQLQGLSKLGLQWDKGQDPNGWAVRDAVNRASGQTKPNMDGLRGVLLLLGYAPKEIPKHRAGRMQELVLQVLYLDSKPFKKRGSGHSREGYAVENLKLAANLWKDRQRCSTGKKLCEAIKTHNHPVLWHTFKRAVLNLCGLYVDTRETERVYYSDGKTRPRGQPQAGVEEGLWRERVRVRGPWAPSEQDQEDDRDRARDKAHVRSAAFEWSMGGAGLEEYCVPLPEDEEALDCPDRSTKAEWDALWPHEELVQPRGFGDERFGGVTQEQLKWTKPASHQGARQDEFAQALQDHPQPPGKKGAAVKLEDLDPTQHAFAGMALAWGKALQQARARPAAPGRGRKRTTAATIEPLMALLLGTAGTGKTTTLKATLEQLRAMQVGCRVAAWTGVAASNVGEGARTLASMFRLGSSSEGTRGEKLKVEKLKDQRLKDFAAEMEGLDLLVIDEISMVSRVVLAQVSDRLKEWRVHQGDTARADLPFGGVAVILAGDFGQLPPTKEVKELSLLCTATLREDTYRARMANLGARLFRGFTKVVRLRRVHRQPGASVYKESLLRLRDAAHTKEDHARWQEHDLGSSACTLDAAQRKRFEGEVIHLFAENAGAGARNGHMAGELAKAQKRTILRVASRDTHKAAERESCERFGQYRRVVHLVEEAPAMIIANLRTEAGLVNGATGTIRAVVLKETLGGKDPQQLRGAVSAADVKYVVLDVPNYCGPVAFPGHPTWVAIEPQTQRHDRVAGWQRTQLPLVLAWGITVHKSQGLTFPDGAVVDFAHHPAWKPVASVGLAFVAMSRSTEWEKQAFRDLPSFWDFRKVLSDELFQWRAAAEEHFDKLHDRTMEQLLGRPLQVDEDLQQHLDWTRAQRQKEATRNNTAVEEVSPEYEADVRSMLSLRGVLPPGVYADEPIEDRGAVQGGGGRSRTTGMRPTPKRKPRAKRAAKAAAEPEQKRARVDEAPGEDAPDGPGAHEFPDLAELFSEEAAGFDEGGEEDCDDFFGDIGFDGDDCDGFGDCGLGATHGRVAPEDRGDTEEAQEAMLSGPFGEHLEGLEEELPAVVDSLRCNRCGHAGHTAENCPAFPYPRLQHPDAFSMARGAPRVRVIRQGDRFQVDGHWYVLGQADGDDNNCLIDTLRQKLRLNTDLNTVRQGLQQRFTVGSQRVTTGFLDLEDHWHATVQLLGGDPSSLRIVCVDLRGTQGTTAHGNTVGEGPHTLCIARVRGNHFVPLLREG